MIFVAGLDKQDMDLTKLAWDFVHTMDFVNTSTLKFPWKQYLSRFQEKFVPWK